MSTISAYTGDGSTTQFDITFPYRDASTVKATVDGVETVDFTFVNPSRIQFATAPSAGAEIKIFRRTPVTPPAVEFEDGAIIRGDDLNDAIAQARDRVEEVDSDVSNVSLAALRAPSGETLPAIASAATRANKFLGFDSSGNPIPVVSLEEEPGLRSDLLSTTSISSGASRVGLPGGGFLDAVLDIFLDQRAGYDPDEDCYALLAALNATNFNGRKARLIIRENCTLATAFNLTNTDLEIHCRGEAYINWTGATTAGYAIKIGDDQSVMDYKRHRINLRCGSAHSWTDQGFIGLLLACSPYYSVFEAPDIRGFGTNVKVKHLSTRGFAYAKVYIGVSVDALRHLWLDAVAGVGDSGWINENLFTIGNAASSAMPAGLDRYAIEISGPQSPNNNTFRACVQLGTGGGYRGGVLLNNSGAYNRFEFERYEFNNGHAMDIVSNSVAVRFNKGFVGYHESNTQSDLVRYRANGTGYGNYLVSRPAAESRNRIDSGPILRRAFRAKASEISVTGNAAMVFNGGTHPYGSSIVGELLYDAISIPNFYGIEAFQIDTSLHKHWTFGKRTRAGFKGNMRIVCFDSAGAVLDDANAGHPYCSFSGRGSATSVGYTPGVVKEHYTTATSSGDEWEISFGPDVARASIWLTGGTTAMHLFGFWIECVDTLTTPQPPLIYSPWQAAGARSCEAEPSTVLGQGFSNRGDVVLNKLAAASGIPAWSAVGSGYHAEAHAVSTAYVVGQYRSNAGNVYRVTVAGTSGAATPPTGTGTAIVDGTVTWAYVGPQGSAMKAHSALAA